VEYRSKRIAFPREMPDEAYLAQIRTKFKSWEYEREWRIFVPLVSAQHDGEIFFESFSDRLRLREVILGTMCTLPLQATRQLVDAHQKEVVRIKSRLADKYYSVVRKKNSVPYIPALRKI